MSSYIKTPDFLATSHLYRKNLINFGDFKRVIKEKSKKEVDTHTKCTVYSAGSSSALDTNFYRGRRLTSREVEQKIKEYFPELSWTEKIAEVGGQIMDKITKNESLLVENISNDAIHLKLEPEIKYPLKEFNANLMGLEQIAPLKLGLNGTFYSNPRKRKYEDQIYPKSSKIIKMQNWESPLQGNWRRNGEENWSPVIVQKGQHIVFDGEVIKEGAMTNNKSQWKFCMQ